MAIRVLLPLLLLVSAVVSSRAEESHVRARLTAPVDAVAPGGFVDIAVVFTIEPEWHIYWRNPGDAGTATAIEWKLPDGYSVDPLQWPVPHAIGEAPEVSYGYESGVMLVARLHVPATARAGDSLLIGAHVEWMSCNDICIPADTALQLRLAIRTEGSKGALFLSREGRDAPPPRLPQPAEHLTAIPADSGYTLRITAPWSGQVSDIAFFPYAEGIIDHSAGQVVRRTEQGLELTLRRSPFATGRAERMEGILVGTILSVGGTLHRGGIEIDIPVAP